LVRSDFKASDRVRESAAGGLDGVLKPLLGIIPIETSKQLKSTYGMDHTPNTPQDVFSRETLIGLTNDLMDWLFNDLMDWLFSSLRFDILIHKKGN
jgi:hypothetical protein